ACAADAVPRAAASCTPSVEALAPADGLRCTGRFWVSVCFPGDACDLAGSRDPPEVSRERRSRLLMISPDTLVRRAPSLAVARWSRLVFLGWEEVLARRRPRRFGRHGLPVINATGSPRIPTTRSTSRSASRARGEGRKQQIVDGDPDVVEADHRR